jgi:hypothetical protein
MTVRGIGPPVSKGNTMSTIVYCGYRWHTGTDAGEVSCNLEKGHPGCHRFDAGPVGRERSIYCCALFKLNGVDVDTHQIGRVMVELARRGRG